MNRQNGLLGDINAFIYRDSRGFMWVSSVQGLNRFDGKNIQTYVYDTSKLHSLWGNNIQSPFFEDKKGDIWFCTGEAINVYRRHLDGFEHYHVHDNKGNPLLFFISTRPAFPSSSTSTSNSTTPSSFKRRDIAG